MPWTPFVGQAFTGGLVWEDIPDQSTAVSAAHLNQVENATVAHADAVGASVYSSITGQLPDPASIVATPAAAADQDLLVRSGSTWARLAVGPRGTQTLVRSDGTIAYVQTMAVSAPAWGVSPTASSSSNLTNLQAAITQATANSGAGDGVTPAAKVEVPAGTVVVNGPLLTKFSLHFYGTGGQTTTIKADDYGDKTTARTHYTAGARSTFPAIMKWDGGDPFAHGVHVVGVHFDTNGIQGLGATWFQSTGEHSWFDDLACSNTAALPRTVTDAQIVGNNKTVTFAASTFTEDDVNALVTDRPDGDHTLAGPTIPAYTKIDLVNYINPGYNPQATDTATSITLSKATTGAANPSSFTIKRPTDAFTFDGGGIPGMIGQLQGVTNSGALLRLKGISGTWKIGQLSGDDNLGGLLRISRDAAGVADPAHVTVHQIKAESNQYNPNWQASHDPVILTDRCSFLDLTVEHGSFLGQSARDVLRIDQEWNSYPQQFGGVVAELNIEGANPSNVQFTNIVHNTTSGEVIEAIPESFVQAGRGRGYYAKILWNKDVLIGGGGRVPSLESWVAGGVYYTRPVWNNCAANNATATGSAIAFAGGIVWYNGTGLLNDSMSWLDDLSAGTYDLAVAGARQPSCGIVTVDFGVKVVPTPAAPGGNLSSVAGTGPPAGFYFVQYAYVTANGETVPGPYTQINMDGAHSLQIASPIWPDIAPQGNPIIGWYAYVTAAGGGAFYRQQPAGAPTPLHTNYTITGAVSTTGAAPATKDTSGVWTSVGTWDQYVATAGDLTFHQFSGVVVPPHSGPVRLRFTVTGRNAANTTGYSMNISGRHWQRTA